MINRPIDKITTDIGQHVPIEQKDMEKLTEFVVHNAELEQLEEKLRQFNIFEAVGMQWQLKAARQKNKKQKRETMSSNGSGG